MKKYVALFLAIVMVFSMAACASSSTKDAEQTPTTKGDTAATTTETTDTADTAETKTDAASTENKTYTLNVSGIDGSITLFPVYLAQEMGWFDEVGMTINRRGFTNGPVQMEAIDTWDIGVTGVGGVLSGTISYDAILLGTVGTDDGTQKLFVRKDTPVAAAGTGHNTLNDAIVGDADSWKGMSINCTYGNVLHYMLLKTLTGFGLTADDVEINWMDQPTCNAAFLAGEGDATCVSGVVSFAADKAEFVEASSGPVAEVGLLTNIMANPKSYADPETREAMKVFLKVFFKATEWITANPEEAVQYMIDWCDHAGNTVDEDTAYLYCTIDPYYTLEENYNTLHEPATDGGSYCRVQEQILGVLRFFIDTESYQQGDDEIFLQDNHFDTSLIDELYEESK